MQAQYSGRWAGDQVMATSSDTSDTDTDVDQSTTKQQLHRVRDVAKSAALAVTAIVALGWLGQHAWGWVQDRLEDRRAEAPEMRQRRLMIRWLRNHLPVAELVGWLDSGLLGGAMRGLFLPAYSAIFELELRQAIPGGPMVWRLEVIYIQAMPGWRHVSAVLDPFAHVLKMTPEMAAALGMQHGQMVSFSVAGREFRSAVSVEDAPDEARAFELAQQAATAANLQLDQVELARRATEIIAERQRCVVVPVGPMQHLLRAGISINMS